MTTLWAARRYRRRFRRHYNFTYADGLKKPPWVEGEWIGRYENPPPFETMWIGVKGIYLGQEFLDYIEIYSVSIYPMSKRMLAGTVCGLWVTTVSEVKVFLPVTGHCSERRFWDVYSFYRFLTCVVGIVHGNQREGRDNIYVFYMPGE